jgi:hypothetical protein
MRNPETRWDAGRFLILAAVGVVGFFGVYISMQLLYGADNTASNGRGHDES